MDTYLKKIFERILIRTTDGYKYSILLPNLAITIRNAFKCNFPVIWNKLDTDSKYFWKNSDKKNRWLQKQPLVLLYITIASLKCPQSEFLSHLERNGHRFKIDFWLLYCYDFLSFFWSSSRNSMVEWIHNRIGLNHFSTGAFVFFFTYLHTCVFTRYILQLNY